MAFIKINSIRHIYLVYSTSCSKHAFLTQILCCFAAGDQKKRVSVAWIIYKRIYYSKSYEEKTTLNISLHLHVPILHIPVQLPL